ncbi:DNA helicase [Tanacetum coccineum]
MKIHQFIKYLQDVQPFGEILAVLYTIKFQKRGLPHCHTLIWIDESVRVRKDEDIDIYISAELPSNDTDPECHRIVLALMMHGPYGLDIHLRHETDIHKRTKNKAKDDKTEHGMEKREKTKSIRSQSQPGKSQQSKPEPISKNT